jgi:hypothetical protein
MGTAIHAAGLSKRFGQLEALAPLVKGTESPDQVHAASSYSWISPPSTSRPWTRRRSGGSPARLDHWA